MENIKVSNRLKEFIEDNIDLIENTISYKNLDLMDDCIFTLRSDTDKICFWKILKEFYDFNEWLNNSKTIPYKFFTRNNLSILSIPPIVNTMRLNSLNYCNIDLLVIKYDPSELHVDNAAMNYCKIGTIVSNRDLYLDDFAFNDLRLLEGFEIYKNIIQHKSYEHSPFPILYRINPDVKFIINNDCKYITYTSTQSLSKHLSDCGFKNIKIV